MSISAADRIAIAAKAGVSEQYLYQCLTGRRAMRTDLAVHVETTSGLLIRRWDLRRDDWWRHWPDLIGTRGAPKVPREKRPRRATAEA